MPNVNAIQPDVYAQGSQGVGLSSAPAKGAPPAAAPAADASAPLTNPSISLDPALGVVVVQYHDPASNVSFSIPSQALLKAYSLGVEHPPGLTHATA